MAGFHLIDRRRLELDAQRIIGDSRRFCTVYRRGAGESADTVQGSFWGRISNIGRQTTGLERALQAANVTGALWVLHAPPGAVTLRHGDEIRSEDDVRWRVVITRSLPGGQVAVISNLQ